MLLTTDDPETLEILKALGVPMPDNLDIFSVILKIDSHSNDRIVEMECKYYVKPLAIDQEELKTIIHKFELKRKEQS